MNQKTCAFHPSSWNFRTPGRRKRSSNLSKQKQVTRKEWRLPRQLTSKKAAQDARQLWGDIPVNLAFNWEWYLAKLSSVCMENLQGLKLIDAAFLIKLLSLLPIPSSTILLTLITTTHSRFHPHFPKEGDQEVPGHVPTPKACTQHWLMGGRKTQNELPGD